MKKNLFKKLVTGVLATSLGVVALTGCGAEKTSDKGNQAYRTLDEIKEVLIDKKKQKLLQIQCFLSMPSDHPFFYYLPIVNGFINKTINKISLK